MEDSFSLCIWNGKRIRHGKTATHFILYKTHQFIDFRKNADANHVGNIQILRFRMSTKCCIDHDAKKILNAARLRLFENK